jgi:hypothetical protein
MVIHTDCTYKINEFHMPLCGIFGGTGIDTTFFVCLAFIQSEQSSDYVWVLEQLAASIEDFPTPGVIITNRCLALMNALSQVSLCPSICYVSGTLTKISTLVARRFY